MATISILEIVEDTKNEDYFDEGVMNQIAVVSEEDVVVDPKKNVVLCGSMKFKDEIVIVSERLKGLGFNVLLPEECIVKRKSVNNIAETIKSKNA